MQSYAKLLLAACVLMWPFSVVCAGCCIAGTYEGIHVDGRACTRPKTESFTMVIYQPKCVTAIKGKFTEPDGGSYQMNGRVLASDGNCVIKGQLSNDPKSLPGEVITYMGTLTMTRLARKWEVADGTYTTNTGCRGTFRMVRQELLHL